MPKQVINLKVDGGEYNSPRVGRYAKSVLKNMRPIVARGPSIGTNGVEVCGDVVGLTQSLQPYYSGSEAYKHARAWVYNPVGGNVYVLIGLTLWSRDSINGNWSKINTTDGLALPNNVSVTPVGMAANGKTVAMVNGSSGQYLNLDTDVFENINQLAYGFPENLFGYSIDVVYHDGYLVYINGENTVYHSGLVDVDNGKSIRPTDFGSTDVDFGGNNSALASMSNYLVVMTKYSTQFFENIGAENFAFQRVSTVGIGCHSANWRVSSGDIIYFVGSGPNYPFGVYSIDQTGAVKRLSNDMIDAKLTINYSGAFQITGTMYTYTEGGRAFLVINIMKNRLSTATASTFGVGYTFEYDISTGVWTDRRSGANDDRWLPLLAFPEPFPINNTTSTGGYIFLGRDPASIGSSDPEGVVHAWYIMPPYADSQTYDIGYNMTCQATTNWIDGGGKSFIVSKVTVQIDGPTTSYSALRLEYSTDGVIWVQVSDFNAGRKHHEFYGVGYFEDIVMFRVRNLVGTVDAAFKILDVTAEVETLGD
jgi:hypothetical protein